MNINETEESDESEAECPGCGLVYGSADDNEKRVQCDVWDMVGLEMCLCGWREYCRKDLLVLVCQCTCPSAALKLNVHVSVEISENSLQYTPNSVTRPMRVTISICLLALVVMPIDHAHCMLYVHVYTVGLVEIVNKMLSCWLGEIVNKTSQYLCADGCRCKASMGYMYVLYRALVLYWSVTHLCLIV